MTPKRWTEDQLREAINTSISYRVVLQKLNIIPAGGNYATLKKWIKKLNIDISHFLHKAANKDRKFGPKRPLDAYLSNKYPIQTHKLRLRLIKEGIFNSKCQDCGLTTWKGLAIALELHHINGNRDDNTLSNLQLLCPNCHAQTKNYRGKNKNK